MQSQSDCHSQLWMLWIGSPMMPCAGSRTMPMAAFPTPTPGCSRYLECTSRRCRTSKCWEIEATRMKMKTLHQQLTQSLRAASATTKYPSSRVAWLIDESDEETLRNNLETSLEPIEQIKKMNDRRIRGLLAC